ncbi:restriction endonuclease subunit S [Priestia megaterium]|uniref:restriction endonuclease subunit S n=1 Tax=Priestia megaterium TaxID=1404 RepID=UPI0027880A76|nr:type I restriction enzyme S subunit [Bacillus sp. 1751]
MNEPKLRFREFNYDWKKVKLTDITTRIGDGLHSTPKYDEKGLIYFANGSNIRKGVLVFDENTKTINHEEFSKYNFHLNDESILVSLNGATWGRFGLYQGELILLGKSLGYINILNTKASKFFMYYQLQLKKNRKFFEREITGSTIKNLSLQTLRNTEVTIPNINEQKKIADFFKNLDRKIQLQQQKIDLLQKQKKGFMQKIFKQEIRFKDEDGKDYPAWELSSLKKIADIYDGTHQTPKYTKSGVKFLSVENIKNLDSNKFISEEDFDKEFKVFPAKNDILMTRIGDIGTANIVLEDQKIAYYVSLALIKCKGINTKFLLYFIQSDSFQKELYRRTLHVAFPKKINKGEIGECDVRIPVLEEQKKIGEIFGLLDKKIKYEEKNLSLFKNQKRGFMQQMFV